MGGRRRQSRTEKGLDAISALSTGEGCTWMGAAGAPTRWAATEARRDFGMLQKGQGLARVLGRRGGAVVALEHHQHVLVG